jgi:hypothetical protein
MGFLKGIRTQPALPKKYDKIEAELAKRVGEGKQRDSHELRVLAAG